MRVPFHLFTLSLLSLSRALSAARARPWAGIAHRTLLAETPPVTLSRVDRFQFRLLSRRNEVSVLFQILDDLFADNLALKSPQRAFDRFVIVNCNKCHLFTHLLSAGMASKGKP